MVHLDRLYTKAGQWNEANMNMSFSFRNDDTLILGLEDVRNPQAFSFWLCIL